MRQFDGWLAGLIGAALLATAVYGGSAGTCRTPYETRQPSSGQRPSTPAGKENAPPKAGAVESAPSPQAEPKAPSPAQKAGSIAGTPKAGASPPAASTVAPGATPGSAGNVSAPANPPAVQPRPPAATGAATSPFPCADGQGAWNTLLGALLALLIGFAALAVGAFTGFLFGLPRTLTGERPAGRSAPPASGESGDGTALDDAPESRSEGSANDFGSDVNTNLERVSNWLTTIIVGVGLTKLEEIDDSLGRLGDFIDGYFGFGGKPFGIAATLFFLVAGFFVIYVGTRVKLSVVFLQSQVDNFRRAKAVISPAVRAAANASVASPATGADEILLRKSLGDLKSDEEIIAWANAKARSGDPHAALTAYRDVLRRVPLTEKLSKDFAVILASTGDMQGAQNVLGALSATSNLTEPAQTEVRQQVSAASLQNRARELQTKLREGLYRYTQRGYEESIKAGEDLMKVEGEASSAMNHVWLACAYGQKHWATKDSNLPQDKKNGMLKELEGQVAEHVERAIALDATVKDLLASLYDPARQVGGDNDLQSIYPTKRLHKLLLE